MYRNFDPKGLYLRTIFLNDKIADFYLPSFIGGDGGVVIEKSIQWAKERNLNRLTRSDFETFITDNNYNLENRDSKKYRQEINRKLQR